ncbi:hypothetical protein POTOM_034327 [Populus tomentosa]|uniref:Uncharacterized protein n=1 Tax=Populus tomentosa TaxID=118781 RepID=A0A8X7Z2D4_POPTO|nr:hypothetical protein POTOM_034327 [Populus tomentosa]
MKCKIWISTIQMHVDSVLVTLSIFQPPGHGPHGCMMAFSPTRSSACFYHLCGDCVPLPDQRIRTQIQEAIGLGISDYTPLMLVMLTLSN